MSKQKFFKAFESQDFVFIKSLIKQPEFDVNITNEHGITGLFSALCWGDDEIIDLLIRNGINIDSQDNSGMTVLIFACRSKDEKNILVLHKQGADFTIKNNDGESALDFLMMHSTMSEKLTALKEKLILEQMTENDRGIINGL